MAEGKNGIWLFYANTESGDQFIAVLPRKLTDREFEIYCHHHYRDDAEAGTLNGRQLFISEKGKQLNG